MIRADQIIRWRVGYVIGPEGHPLAGRRIMVCAYLIRHPDGVFLFDTGIGADPEVDALFRPVRWPLEPLLDRLGARRTDIAAVANCHLHFDHAGGNPGFAGLTIYAQRTEFEAAHGDDYTLPEIVRFAGSASHGQPAARSSIWRTATSSMRHAKHSSRRGVLLRWARSSWNSSGGKGYGFTTSRRIRSTA